MTYWPRESLGKNRTGFWRDAVFTVIFPMKSHPSTIHTVMPFSVQPQLVSKQVINTTGFVQDGHYVKRRWFKRPGNTGKQSHLPFMV